MFLLVAMRRNHLELNFAHLPGDGGLAISPDGLYTLTGSVDCALRAHDICATSAEPWWIKGPSHEPPLYEVPATDIHEKPICGVAISLDSRTFATACEDGFVRLFSATVKPEDPFSESFDVKHLQAELIQACARFGAPVRAVSFSPTGAFLAAAGDEPGVVKIIMTAHPSQVSVMRAEGCAIPASQAIKSLSYDPLSDFIATIASNGCAAVWNISEGNCLGPLALNDRMALCVTWSPDGSQLLVGTDNGAVFVRRDSWSFEKALEDPSGGDVDDDMHDFVDVAGGAGWGAVAKSRPSISVLSVAWSKNGRYILTARSDMSIRLWDSSTFKVLAVWQADCVAQSVQWHPFANAFMVFDSIGQFVVVPDVVPAQMPPPYCGSGVEAGLELPQVPKKSLGLEGGDGSSSEDGSTSESSSDDETDERERATSSTRRRSSRVRRGDESNGDGDVIDDDHIARPDLLFDADDIDADEEDDPVQLRRRRLVEREHRAAQEDSEEECRRRRRRRRQRKRAAWLKEAKLLIPDAHQSHAQNTFMPSSTRAIAAEETKKKILFWNLTAAVLSHDEKSHNVVDIEFADKTRRTIGIKDHFGFTLGCVSETGVLLACPKTKEHGSIISFRPFSSWSSNSDWTQSLAHEESALTVALGARFAAVSSDRNIVRLFSLSGIQTDVCGIPGRVVTMAAAGNKLAVVYSVSPHSAAMRFQLLDVANSGEVAISVGVGDIVLSPNSQLEWLGFASDTLDLVAYDSSGCVWLYRRAVWLPILQDAAKSADCQWFWVASASSGEVIGAQCFGDEKRPAASPRPALRKVGILAPVIEQLTKSGQSTVEERLFRARLSLSRALEAKTLAEDLYGEDDDELEELTEVANGAARELDKCLLALMEVACRKEQNLRAFDIATRLSNCISLKFAVNLANHYKRAPLAGRIEEVYRRRAALEASSNAEANRGQEASNFSGPAVLPAPPLPSKLRQREPTGTSPVTPVAGRQNSSESDGAESGKDDDVMTAVATSGGPLSSNRPAAIPLQKSAQERSQNAPLRSSPSTSAKKRLPPVMNRFAKRAKS